MPSVDELFSLGLSSKRAGRLHEALANYDRVIALKPVHAEAYNNRGNVLLDLRRYDEALLSYERAISLRPDYSEAYNNRGIVLCDLGRRDEGVLSYERAIFLRQDYPEAHNNLGVVLYALKHYEGALASYDRAVSFNPGYANAYNNRGVILKFMHRHAAALESYDRAIALQPDYVEACNNRGILLHDMGRYAAALEDFDKVISLKPDYVEAYNNRGVVLQDMHRYADALENYDWAIARKPDYAEAHNNRGVALQSLDRHQEAMASIDRAIALKPAYAEAYNNRGRIFEDLARHEEALREYDKAVALRPDYAYANFNSALSKLSLGNFKEGWPLYEWRWKKDPLKDFVRNFEQALWLGDTPIAGKTILLHAEQGFGDTIQCARYIPMVAALDAKLILELPPALITLFRNLDTAVTLITEGDALPRFDLHCPLLSLPLAFKTTVDTIPAEAPYLAAGAQKQAAWRGLLGPKVKLRVGLVWSSASGHKRDRFRSMRLRTLEPVLHLDCEFHSLQIDVREEDREALAAFKNIRFHGEKLHDFADTAALASAMDVIISVDTAVAHLAGALGKPVWIVLPFSADWRWLVGRNDSPWYPTARLFRQKAIGEWEGVMEEVVSALRTEFFPSVS